MKIRKIEEVIPEGFYCIDNLNLIVDTKNQKSFRKDYICPFYNDEKKKCWYIKKEIVNKHKLCDINNEELLDIDEDAFLEAKYKDFDL